MRHERYLYLGDYYERVDNNIYFYIFHFFSVLYIFEFYVSLIDPNILYRPLKFGCLRDIGNAIICLAYIYIITDYIPLAEREREE